MFSNQLQEKMLTEMREQHFLTPEGESCRTCEHLQFKPSKGIRFWSCEMVLEPLRQSLYLRVPSTASVDCRVHPDCWCNSYQPKPKP